MNYILENLRRLKENVIFVCEKTNRNPSEIKILPITKGIDIHKIKFVYELGFREFGENRVKEAIEKVNYLPSDINWHLVGHLQTNKVRKALKIFKVIQSIDRFEVIDEIEKNKVRIDVFIEFNCSDEPQKHGFNPENFREVVERVLKSEYLNLIGLMTIGPYPVNEAKSRKAFEKLRIIKEKIKENFNLDLKLSMGMSEDYIYAIMEGSDMIRIGRALFSDEF
ncbi:MAG: YggS family pyridoxal phosphate-dependent enzyme [candidate division WOR-3 bacterium]